MKNIISAAFFLTLLSVGSKSFAQTPWLEKEIIAFEKQDSIKMPESGSILFVGSSSIRGWRSLPQDYPDRKILNRGFGGSEFKDANHYFNRIISKYKPSQVVIYEGDNDIASGKSPEQVFNSFLEFVDKMEKGLPNTQLVILSIKPSISRWEKFPDMQAVNQRMREYASEKKWITFVNVATPMLDENGEPKAELFLGDGIHMKEKGYEIWREVLEPYLIKN